MVLGNILSFLAMIVHITSFNVGRSKILYLNLIESVLLSISSWYLDMRVSAILFAISSLSFLLQIFHHYWIGEMMIGHILMIPAILFFDNGHWSATLLILPAMSFLLHTRIGGYMRHDNYYNCPLKGGWFDFIATGINLLLWIGYSVIAHDYNTLVARSMLLLRNIHSLLTTKLSKQARIERAYIRRMRKYKRYPRY